MNITHDRLVQVLHYNLESGVFTWKINRPRARAGSVAGHVNKRGYLKITVDGQEYAASRLAVLYVTKKWPRNEVDHRNEDKLDNSYRNLRDVTHAQNEHNQSKPQSNNKLNIQGVCASQGRYMAQIKVGGVVKYLGRFDTPEEASQKYQRSKLIYHGTVSL